MLGGGERLLERVLGEAALLLQLGEVRGVLDRLADVVADEAHGDRDEERHAPGEAAPAAAVDRLGGEPRRHRVGDEGAGQQGDEGRDLREAGEEAAASLGGVLGQEGHRAGGLAADGEALHDAQQHQQDRRRDADGGVARQHADAGGRDADEHDDEHQHLLAADAVAQVAADDRAERADEERHGVAGEHQHERLGARLDVEEDDRECGRHEGEDAVVVQLDENADAAGEDDLPDALVDLLWLMDGLVGGGRAVVDGLGRGRRWLGHDGFLRVGSSGEGRRWVGGEGRPRASMTSATRSVSWTSERCCSRRDATASSSDTGRKRTRCPGRA